MIKLEGDKIALYQWDLDQRLILTGVGPDVEVHCSHNNDTKDECPNLLTYEENGFIYADIPNILLQLRGIITVYVYIQNERGAYTKNYVDILVLPREKPADYVYTETEVKNYETLEKRIRSLEQGGLPDIPSNLVTKHDMESYAQPKGKYITEEGLGNAIDIALKQASESGNFNGKTPVKGEDYFTPAEVEEISKQAAKLVKVPDAYTKSEIDAIMGAYITDIDTLIGGEA